MNTVVILPSYNPDEKMPRTVKGLLDEGFTDIVVVDDGSGAEHKRFFEEAEKYHGVEVLTHEVNKGKGSAIKTAFSHIIQTRRGIDGVVTVDGDGQHLPRDIRRCVARMEECGDRVVLGVRDFSGSNVPFKSRFGNRLTRTVFRLACGIKASDTQTGLRAIPAAYLPQMLSIPGTRYEYETNQLLYLKRLGIGTEELVIETVYLDNNESSHFHPVRDSVMIYGVILKFIASSLASSGVDILLFTLLNLLLSALHSDPALRLLIATAGARLVSSLCNYLVNRGIVFRSGASAASTLPKYYLLCVCQTAASYGLVYLVSALTHSAGIWDTVIKIIIDLGLFVASFQIQQRWVFKR